MYKNYFNDLTALRSRNHSYDLSSLFYDFIKEDKQASYYVKKDEDTGSYSLEIPLPGCKNEDINIKITKSLLSININPKNSSWCKSNVMKFSVPKEINKEHVTASLENGLLKIILPTNKDEELSIKVS